MPLNNQPHASWAEVYDLAYEQSFGCFYTNLTYKTLEVITEVITTDKKIIDFGAGTGRLSIPLAEKGFEVTSVEPCLAMLEQLEQKKQPTMKLKTVCSTMQDYKGQEQFDFAMCVFTVLIYLLDEQSLKKALIAAYDALKPNGLLFLDIPSVNLFNSYSRITEQFERNVLILKQENNLYLYLEDFILNHSNNEKTRYQDEFFIKHWEADLVDKLLVEIGFLHEADLTEYFIGSGSHYWLMRKAKP
ncbi:MAG: hypothetical protein RLZZ215_2428 [Pseudomonadota bacterium]|jgi:SAM-dependent methyltransferase